MYTVSPMPASFTYCSALVAKGRASGLFTLMGQRVKLAGSGGASLASGSFATAGMVVAPCSVRTLAAIASGKIIVPAHIRPDTVAQADFRGPKMPWIDPLKEANALSVLARNGVESLFVLDNQNGRLYARLVPGADGRRAAAVEIMLNTPHISDLIRKGDVSTIKEAIQASGEKGIQSFDHSLLDLYKAGRVTMDDALVNADSRSNLEARINFG